MEDLISVIVSVYNIEHALVRMLSCLANQTYKNLEIILVDDGSTDSSGQICDSYAKTDSRCKVIHKQNEGQSSAKNAGQKKASGKYLFFPDGDDTFNLDILRILHEAISKDPDYDLAISGRKIVLDWDTETDPPFVHDGILPITEYSQQALIQGLFKRDDDRFIYGWNKLYRKDLLDNLWCGDYPRHQDFDFNFRVFLRARKAVFVNLELYHWVQWSGSKTHQPNTMDLYYKSRAAILYENWTHLDQKNRKYGHYLLDALYRTMVFWKERGRLSRDREEIEALCNDYQIKTKNAYYKEREIGLFMKCLCLTLLSFPGLSHLVMKLTSNAR